MKRIVVDTNAYSALIRGNDTVLELLECSEVIYFPTVVLAELFAGFKGGTHERKNRAVLDDFLSRDGVSILEITVNTAEIYADIFHTLKLKGKPIPVHDIWICAHAFEWGAMVVTADKHFKEIEGLRLHML